MPEYKDKGHRPHGIHTGEVPRNDITDGPDSISVILDSWGPQNNLFPAMYDALQSNWGDAPSRTVFRACPHLPELEPELIDKSFYNKHYWSWEHQTGRCMMADEEWAYLESCFAGSTLPQVLERITFSFTIDGVTRCFTHQEVRTRIGAAFMQHGGRDNDWRHRPWTMPETIRRACDMLEHPDGLLNGHCVTDWQPILDFVGQKEDQTLHGSIADYLAHGRALYAALVDAGIPWQDARRLLWNGQQTFIHADYNYLALQSTMARRLEHVMDWEFNCVAQLIVREVNRKCPPIFGKYLQSMSDRANKAMFAGLESWPPDGKYPNPYERCKCGHPKSTHLVELDNRTAKLCTLCGDLHHYEPVDTLPRTHRPEQNPYWVLHPDSMAGGPVVWVPTNGTYPKEFA